MQNQQPFDYQTSADDDLVKLAQQDDQQAFAVLIERYYSACQKVAFNVLRERYDAEDEVQNACWKAYRHIQQFHQDAKFSTWLTRIVVNQCLMRLRQNKRSRLVYLEEAARPGDFPCVERSPEAAVARQEFGEVLCREIGRTPPLLRNVFLLREVQELPMEDVANKLGISVAAAKSRLLRARQELRSRLEKYQGRLGTADLLD